MKRILDHSSRHDCAPFVAQLRHTAKPDQLQMATLVDAVGGRGALNWGGDLAMDFFGCKATTWAGWHAHISLRRPVHLARAFVIACVPFSPGFHFLEVAHGGIRNHKRSTVRRLRISSAKRTMREPLGTARLFKMLAARRPLTPKPG